MAEGCRRPAKAGRDSADAGEPPAKPGGRPGGVPGGPLGSAGPRPGAADNRQRLAERTPEPAGSRQRFAGMLLEPPGSLEIE